MISSPARYFPFLSRYPVTVERMPATVQGYRSGNAYRLNRLWLQQARFEAGETLTLDEQLDAMQARHGKRALNAIRELESKFNAALSDAMRRLGIAPQFANQ